MDPYSLYVLIVPLVLPHINNNLIFAEQRKKDYISKKIPKIKESLYSNSVDLIGNHWP